MEEKGRFNIKFDKILQLLCSEIYDSSLSMLRENVQNAYDAILMRKHDDPTFKEGVINIHIEGKVIEITDNGIGMTRETLENNYWTAGSSGKNNAKAKAAGVVGTFGIGAMANFGVCEKLTVITRSYTSEITITSWVSKADLASNDECIHYSSEKNHMDHPGTRIIVELDPTKAISPLEAKEYLYPYIKFIPATIRLNGEILSKRDYHLNEAVPGEIEIEDSYSSYNGISFKYRILLNKGTYINPRIELSEISYKTLEHSLGYIVLNTSDHYIYGLRNGFGLAPIPIPSIFNFGGVADLINLKVTAGRDAVSRDSVGFVMTLVMKAEDLVAEAIAQFDIADNSKELHQYIKAHQKYNLASKIRLSIANSEDRLSLGEVEQELDGKKVMYYTGTDKTLLNSFEDNNTVVLIPSNDRTRRQIQINVLRQKGIEEISDTPAVRRIIPSDSLSSDEFSILYRIKTVVEDDYLIPNCETQYAEISHGISIMVTGDNNKVTIYLRKDSPDLNTLKEIYKNDYSVFEQFVKDFVRTRIYSKISQYIPSSQKDGADALYEVLQRKKELYTIETEDYGSMDHVVKEYLSGRAGMEDVLRAVNKEKKQKTQTLSAKSIGSAHEILGNRELNPVKIDPDVDISFDPMPPIMRLDTQTSYKVLTTERENKIEGYGSFLAVWEKMDREFRDFFLQPHTTRIIWSMHKIIYIFTHTSGSLTLYYEMELHKKLKNEETGGKLIKSATIITKNKIFVPIIDELSGYFNIVKKEQLKFMVRFDSVKN